MNVIDVHLRLTADTPDSMNFADTYAGLENIWYKFEADAHGNITMSANADGFEHLARYFLKMARGRKSDGYHAHHALEFGADQYADGKELTIEFVADLG
ncbi:MAG TPA: hypothetical protein VFG68_09855 [Fimbriiglobus sp.]|nr:hypothetical protein [Fimbriiglobus sp.]